MRWLALVASIATLVGIQAQDLPYARQTVDTLTSPYFWGRGYTNNGMQKAADYLVAEFKKFGLQPLNGKNFKQEFSYSVNTFPGKVEVELDGQKLKPGIDFLIAPGSNGIKTTGALKKKDSVHFLDNKNKIEVVLTNRLMWSVATEPLHYTSIEINKKILKQEPKQLSLSIESKWISNFKASNVCGIVKGTRQPDSLLVVTAHYDHLGGMGKHTYFPGANDNASGTALMLALAKHYAANPAPYSIAFIAFAGEEAGLVGSKFFSENPLIDLKKIRFLINIDLAGTGDEGITAVNGSVFRSEFALLNEINSQKQYLTKIKSRGKAANSDHYWFTEKGVPSFFIYAMGGIQAYHDVYDRAETLPLTEFEDLFRLITDFYGKLTH